MCLVEVLSCTGMLLLKYQTGLSSKLSAFALHKEAESRPSAWVHHSAILEYMVHLSLVYIMPHQYIENEKLAQSHSYFDTKQKSHQLFILSFRHKPLQFIIYGMVTQ